MKTLMWTPSVGYLAQQQKRQSMNTVGGQRRSPTRSGPSGVSGGGACGGTSCGGAFGHHMAVAGEPTADDATVATQRYFYLTDVDFAIPICDAQSYVKLADGQKRDIEVGQIYTVEYDCRGLPIRTFGPDMTRQPWILEKPGMGIKLQRFFVHQDLVQAVPIVHGQQQVPVTDGDSLTVTIADIITVYFDARGKAVFHFAGYGRTKVRPGPVNDKLQGGFPKQVSYYAIGNAAKGISERLEAHQIQAVQTYYNENGVMKAVDRNRIAVAYHDPISDEVVYSQVEDGSLIYGSLSNRYDVIAFDMDSGILGDQFAEVQGDAMLASVTSSCASSLNRRGSPGLYYGNGGTTGQEAPTIAQAPAPAIAQAQAPAPAPVPAPADPKHISNMPPPELRLLSCGDYERITYVEVPKDIEVIKKVAVKRTEVLERRVMKKEYEIVEKIIEVPEIVYVDKHVDVEKIEYTTTYVKKKEVIQKPVEQIRYVPKIEKKIIEKVIEIPQIIEVPKVEIIQRKVAVDNFIDRKEPTVVAQRVNPIIRQSESMVEKIECFTLEPELVAVDVYVPKPVHRSLIPVGVTNETQQEVSISAAHFNSLAIQMNPHIQGNFEKLPLVKIENGSFPVMPKDACLTVIAPSNEIVKEMLTRAKLIKAPCVVRRTTGGSYTPSNASTCA